MIGHPKTGQHWVMFFLAHYHNLALKLGDSIDWAFIGEFAKLKLAPEVLAPDQWYLPNYPKMKWVEYSRAYDMQVKKLFDSFDKKFYIYRNPGDVMVSMFFYFMRDYHLKEIAKSKDWLKNNEYFNTFVKMNLDEYLSHIEVTIDHCDLVLSYDELRRDPHKFMDLLFLFHDNIDPTIFQKALYLSSFEVTKEIELEAKKEQENPTMHCRDGRSNQYLELMDESLIKYITKKWNELKKRVKYPL
jgi:hypothetical protein